MSLAFAAECQNVIAECGGIEQVFQSMTLLKESKDVQVEGCKVLCTMGKQMITLTTTLTLQRRRRGEMCRRYLQIVKPQLQRRRNVVQAALLINRIWRGYYPRRYRRRQWWIQNGPKNI